MKKQDFKNLKKKLKKYPDLHISEECRVCGCVWDEACVDDRRACYWIDNEQTLCSHCFDDLIGIDKLRLVDVIIKKPSKKMNRRKKAINFIKREHFRKTNKA